MRDRPLLLAKPCNGAKGVGSNEHQITTARGLTVFEITGKRRVGEEDQCIVRSPMISGVQHSVVYLICAAVSPALDVLPLFGV